MPVSYTGGVKNARPWIVYTSLRLLMFFVPLGLMLLLPIFRELWWVAIIFATLIAAALSYIFLSKPLADASVTLHERDLERKAKRKQTVTEEDIEDAIAGSLDD